MSLTMKRKILFAGACAMASAGAAIGQDVTLPFDGNAAPGAIVTGVGATAPTFVPGQSGQAIYFSDESAVAVPAEIDPRNTPQISITAWIKRSPAANHGWLIDSGSNFSLPSLRLSGGKLAGRGGRDLKTMSISSAVIPPDEWTFIAGIWDFTALTMQLYKGDKSELFNNLRMDPNDPWQVGEQIEISGPGGMGVYVTIGANDFINFGGDVNGVAIDDVRIYNRALSAGEITTLAGGGALAPDAPETPEDDPDVADTKPAEASNKPKPAEAGGTSAETPGLADPRVGPKDPGGDLYLPEGSTGDSGLPPTEGYGEEAYRPALDEPEAADKGKTRKPAKEKAQEAAREKARKASEEAAARREEEEAARREAERRAAEAEAARKAEEESAAAPGGEPYPVGDPVITRISGGQGGIERRLDLAADGSFMTDIWWYEKSNRPCRISIFGPSGRGVLELSCAVGEGGLAKSVSSNPTSPIAAIQVCNNRNNSKNRLKGIRVWGDSVNPDGTTSPGYSSDEVELRNCTDWDKVRRCPANHLATGVVVVADEPAGTVYSTNIRGLRLICRRVEMR